MLSLSTLKTAAQTAIYFDRDNYYSRDQSSEKSKWYGKGAEELGLEGEVSNQDFRNLLEGRDTNGERIVQLGPFEHHKPGIDMTFSAPKSASLLALVKQDLEVVEVWDRSVDRALEQTEREFAQTRITKDGETEVVKTRNLIIARFEHDTSRARDPQLHTHCVVMNATLAPDEKWHALYTDDIYKFQRSIGMRQQLDFANELEKLGYEIERGPNGKFEVVGFREDQLIEFSQRSEQIKEEQHRLAQTMGDEAYTSAGAERANLNTRESKKTVDHEELRRDWRERAEKVDIEWPETQASKEHDQQAAKDAISFARDHAFERSSVVHRHDLLEASYEYGIGRSTVSDIDSSFRQSIQYKDLIRVDEDHFTTREAIQRERETVLMMQAGRNRSKQIASRRELETPDHFTEGQKDAAHLILTNRDSVIGVQGYSGSGKSSMLEYAREQAEERGWNVRGFAPSAQAAEELEKKSGIKSQTLTSHLNELESEKIPQVRGKEMWVVDEASMMSTSQAHDLLRQADRRGVKVTLIGDTNQLASVEAGAPFQQLQNDGMKTVEMREILRQEEGHARKAVELQYEGEQRRALSMIPTVEVQERIERHQAVADDYLKDRNGAVVITLTNSDKDSINGKIREGLIKQEELGNRPVNTTVLVQKDLTRAELKDPANYERGDVIRFGSEQKRLGIERGRYAEVQVSSECDGMLIRNDKGETHQWNPEKAGKAIEVYRTESREIRAGEQIRFTRNDRDQGFINNKTALVKELHGNEAIIDYKGSEQRINLSSTRHHFDYAYAGTAHSAQGIDADRAIADLDTKQRRLISRESVLVTTSRGKQGTTIYTDNVNALPWRSQESHAQKIASHELANAADRPPEQSRHASVKGMDLGM
jgi:conjugative relaxase-like TrwC/TraI family protein